MKKELLLPFGTFLIVVIVAVMGYAFMLSAPKTKTEPDPEPDTTTSQVHMTVHIEPAGGLNSAIEKWDTLQTVLELADAYDMKLSLHFSPSMAQFAYFEDERLNTVRTWEANGHEIGMHHHGLSHVEWDGYTNAQFFTPEPGHKGDIEAMMEIISRLPADGEILVGSGTDEETEWPEGVIYATKGGSPPSAEDILGPVETHTWNGTDVLVLTKAPYSVDQVSDNLSIEDVLEALQTAESDEYIGLTITDNTIGDDLEELEHLFQALSNKNIHTQTLINLLSNIQYENI